MRKIALLALVAAIAIVFGMPADADKAPMAVGYDSFGPDGVLRIAHGHDRHFVVTDAHNAPLMDGFAHGEYFEAPCPNSGPDFDGTLLRVYVDNGTQFVIDDPEDWAWE